MRNAYFFIGKHEGKGKRDKYKRRWKEIIKMDLKQGISIFTAQ
jgi:hypothetical protein